MDERHRALKVRPGRADEDGTVNRTTQITLVALAAWCVGLTVFAVWIYHIHMHGDHDAVFMSENIERALRSAVPLGFLGVFAAVSLWIITGGWKR